MSGKTFRICLSIMAVIIGALIWLNVGVRNETPGDVYYQMTNQRITWSGAGYSGRK